MTTTFYTGVDDGDHWFEVDTFETIFEALTSYFELIMDLLRACDDLKCLIETAQRLIETWDEDPDNYSKLEQHLTELKAEIEKLKD